MRLRYTPPLAWDALLSFLRSRTIAGVEAVGDDWYERIGAVRVTHDAANACLVVSDAAHTDRVRNLFDLDADVAAIRRRFARDAMLGPVVRKHGVLRVPGAWDPFEVCVRAIVGQQVSVAGATTIMQRIVTRYGTSPERIARARGTNIGMPGARWETIRGIARAAAEGELTLERIAALRGIGPWTANYIAMRVFRDRDAFPHSDLGIRKAMAMAPEREILARAEAWRPWRAYAAMLLWRSL